MKRFFLLFLAFFALLAIWMIIADQMTTGEPRGGKGPTGKESPAAGGFASASSNGRTRLERTPSPDNPDPRLIRYTDGTVDFLQSIEASRELHRSPDPMVDLALVEQLVADFRLAFKQNPIGSENAEIVAQLLAQNPKKVYFIDPNSAALNAQGELLDRWGSPFIFHPLTAEVMDIRSLGPDKTLWTEDDLSLDLKEIESTLQLNPDDPS